MIEITLDIETIPNQNLKDFHYKIIERKLENKQDKDIIKYSAINPEFSQIICICININNVNISFIDIDENKLLNNFYNYMKQFNKSDIKIITFNGKKFDIPTILLRSAILKIVPTIKLTNKRYDTFKHYDCFEILSNFYQNYNTLKLQEYALIFGIENNDISSGNGVYNLFKENKLEEINKHCIEDITTTNKLYKILNNYF